MRDIGGIWSICGVNNDTELALGTITGLYFVTIGIKVLNRTTEHYMKDRNIWNVVEVDDNKCACTRWDNGNVYLIDRNDPKSIKKPVEIVDPDKNNKNTTDLIPLPNYDPQECPFLVKRGNHKVCLVDVKTRLHYVLFEDYNNKWGYNKTSVIDRGEGRFNILYVSNEGKTDQIIKRIDFPAIFGEGLRKIVNLRHEEEKPSLFAKIFR